MKKLVLAILISGLPLIFSKSVNSGVVVGNCNARCYWDDWRHDCYLDGNNAQCGSMRAPNPYSTYTPCECCITISPIK